MQRRALFAGLTAFLAVLVAGSALVTLVRRVGASAGERSSPTPSSTPSGSPAPAKPQGIDAYLAWVPGGFPASFGARVAHMPVVSRVTVVAGDNVWMTASESATGVPVDQPTAPYMIPVDAIGIDVASYTRFLPPKDRATARALGDGQAILGQTSSQIRGLGPGAIMHFDTGASVTIVGVLPDDLVGAAELVVNRATGTTIGINTNRYLLFQTAKGLNPSARQMQARLEHRLPSELLYPLVRVRAPGEAAWLRAGDLVLPASLIKKRFGEWAGRPDAAHPGLLEIDPTWLREHIVTRQVPLLGQVTCNRKLFHQLRGAMQQVQRDGLDATIHSFSGCFSARYVERAPDAGISHHAWGIAVDINADTNPFGVAPTQDPRLVRIMEDWGFVWGGDFLVPDGMHFEYARPASTHA